MRKIYYSKKNPKKRSFRIIGVFFVIGGLSLFFYFFYPFLLWNIFFSETSSIEVPIPKYSIADSNLVNSLISSGFVNLSANFEDARNWYPMLNVDKKEIKVESYVISIPKLGIKNGRVSTTSYDLSSHLVHYNGTALPGDKGTTVIFGHSSLPQLFSSSNYRTIFSTLHLLKTGDSIVANINGVVYSYVIDEIIITDPTNTTMFYQDYDSSNLTLVTCTPPGTIWKRLVIKAKLDKLSKKIYI